MNGEKIFPIRELICTAFFRILHTILAGRSHTYAVLFGDQPARKQLDH